MEPSLIFNSQSTNRRHRHRYHLLPLKAKPRLRQRPNHPPTTCKARSPWRVVSASLRCLPVTRITMGRQHIRMEQRSHHRTPRTIWSPTHRLRARADHHARDCDHSRSRYLRLEHHWRHVVPILYGFGYDAACLVSDNTSLAP